MIMSKVVTDKVRVGIDGFDEIAYGGVPRGRSTLVSGTAGSGKTLFVIQFLVEGIRRFDEPGVLVTFEEEASELIRNVASLKWDLQAYIDAGKLVIVDASLGMEDHGMQVGDFDLHGLLVRIEHAVRTIGAQRVSMDAVGALFPQFADAQLVRRELHRLVLSLRNLQVTTLLTFERLEELGPIARLGVEEFVADNAVILRNRSELDRRRRTVEILKFRGAHHRKGEYPFTIDPRDGIDVLPMSDAAKEMANVDERISTGIDELDIMMEGGLFSDHDLLITGSTGTGKTLTVTQFLNAGVQRGENVVLVALEENRQQLKRNARNWGFDYDSAEDNGLLTMVCRYPERMGLEDHLVQIRRVVEEVNPTRVAIDSMSAIERISTPKSFREFVIGLTGFFKQRGIAAVYTNTSPGLVGAASLTESHISTVTDSIIMLRYVELGGQMRRALTVLKMRGSGHEKSVREYIITSAGMRIKGPLPGVPGLITGTSSPLLDEQWHLGRLFDDE